MALFPAIARLTALPGAVGASRTKRFKELLVIAVGGGRGLEGEKNVAQVPWRWFRRQAKETSWVDHIH